MGISSSQFGGVQFPEGSRAVGCLLASFSRISRAFGKLGTASPYNWELPRRNSHFPGRYCDGWRALFRKRDKNSGTFLRVTQKRQKARFCGTSSRYLAPISHHIPAPTGTGIYCRGTAVGPLLPVLAHAARLVPASDALPPAEAGGSGIFAGMMLFIAIFADRSQMRHQAVWQDGSSTRFFTSQCAHASKRCTHFVSPRQNCKQGDQICDDTMAFEAGFGAAFYLRHSRQSARSPRMSALTTPTCLRLRNGQAPRRFPVRIACQLKSGLFSTVADDWF